MFRTHFISFIFKLLLHLKQNSTVKPDYNELVSSELNPI